MSNPPSIRLAPDLYCRLCDALGCNPETTKIESLIEKAEQLERDYQDVVEVLHELHETVSKHPPR